MLYDKVKILENSEVFLSRFPQSVRFYLLRGRLRTHQNERNSPEAVPVKGLWQGRLRCFGSWQTGTPQIDRSVIKQKAREGCKKNHEQEQTNDRYVLGYEGIATFTSEIRSTF